MTAASADNLIQSRNVRPYTRFYPCIGSEIIFAGTLVAIDSTGFAQPAIVEAATSNCVGVAVEQADNSGGSSGDISVEVMEGEFLLVADTLTQAALGTVVFADDDSTVDTTSTNAPRAGVCTEFVSATSVWVEVSLGTCNSGVIGA